MGKKFFLCDFFSFSTRNGWPWLCSFFKSFVIRLLLDNKELLFILSWVSNIIWVWFVWLGVDACILNTYNSVKLVFSLESLHKFVIVLFHDLFWFLFIFGWTGKREDENEIENAVIAKKQKRDDVVEQASLKKKIRVHIYKKKIQLHEIFSIFDNFFSFLNIEVTT